MPKSVAEIKRTRNGKYRVRYFAANGEIIAVSEVLETTTNALKNIKAMKKLMDSIP